MEHSEFWTFINNRAASHIKAAHILKLSTVQVYKIDILERIASKTGADIKSHPSGGKDYLRGGLSATSGETTFFIKH